MQQGNRSTDTVELMINKDIDSLAADVTSQFVVNANKPQITFQIDAKPVDNNGTAAKLDYTWAYQSGDNNKSLNMTGSTTGTLSAQKKDTSSSLIFQFGVLQNIGSMNYVPFQITIQSQNTQDFYTKDIGIEPSISFPTRQLGDWFRPGLWMHTIFGDVSQAAPDPILFIGIFGGERIAPKGDSTKGIARLEGNTDWYFH